VSPASRSAAPAAPASRSASPVSPAGRPAESIDPVSPAGRPARSHSSGLTPPPPPVARRADAPAPPPPPVARPSHAAAPPPARATRPAATREQNAWARPATPAAQPASPAPAPRSPASAASSASAASTDERWAAPSRPAAPAPEPATRPASPPAEATRPQTGATPTGTARVQSGPAPAEAAAPPAESAWTQPAPARPADDEQRWAPKVPPDVETRPLGSRTRFFAQPGEDTESFETEDAEQSRTQPAPYPAQPRPEPTPSSAASTPSPVAPPPTAPEPDRPFPSAPEPATPRRTAPRPGIDQIDIPLDNFPLRGHLPIDTNPEPAPETTPQAATARADGIVAPPAEETPRPSALRDGILGVAVGRAAVSPDAFPTPHPDETPAQEPATEKRTGPWGDFSGRPDEHAGDVITGYPSARPATAGSIHGVGITVLVTDLDRSTEFYRDVLGFHEIDNGDGSAVLASGDTRLVLRTVHNLTSEAGRLIYLNLEVGDIEAVHSELREKGVKFIHSPRPVNRGDKLELWSATFRDPDNHNIAITQWRAIR
ncbi:VOC family protein, partial [Actinoplanes sp. NPDC026670]|uniref:VOC family protein n=1 Tax=Actinoplanes sp. NPDC026670 TaxID=3154700 RepID=UPI0033EE2628